MKKNAQGILTDKQADVLKIDLDSKGITQSELADKMQMSQPEFSRLLHRARKNAVKAKETMSYLKEIEFFKEDLLIDSGNEVSTTPSKPSNEPVTVFHKKLKLKLKDKGEKGRIQFLNDYLNYLIKNKKTLPPDFPSFAREIMGLDDKSGSIHITIWHEQSELVEFAINNEYEYRVGHYD